MTAQPDDFSHLDRAGEATARLATRSRAVVYGSVAAALGVSWGLLVILAASEPAARGLTAGPGAGLLPALPISLPAPLRTFVGLCLSPVQPAASATAQFAALVAMWMLTSVAMMLPSAAPMLRTYCEIADTAAARGEPAAHPLVLLGGYLSAWFAAALVLGGLTMALGAIGGVVSLGFGAAALGLAGAYQFSSLKEACLEKCRHPFALLFANWSARPSRIFRLGVEQGLWCIGCCWALMLVMFAVGVMNLFWMALIALFAVVEKQASNRVPTLVAGAILLVWAAALLVSSL